MNTLQVKAQETEPSRTVLMVTAIDNIEQTAALLAGHLEITVEIASSRAAALRLLGRRSYSMVVLDQMLADGDPEGTDLIWKQAGLAIPLQISFALAGGQRLERELRAALVRRRREQQLAKAAAAAAVDTELKNAITGLLLESELALAESGIPPHLEMRLRTLAELAGSLRDRLSPGPPHATTGGLQPMEH